MPGLPLFLSRALLLRRARRALVQGELEAALGYLRHPALVLSRRAEWMRSRTLEELCRAAARRAGEGRAGSQARLLAMVRSEDPERARAWQPDPEPAPPERERAAPAHDALLGLLRELRHGSQAAGAPAAVPAPPASEPPASEPAVPARAARAQPVGAEARGARLVRLCIDDGGESLLALARSLSIGHLRSGADLACLADVEALHARIVWNESFHAGAGWMVEPLAGKVLVGEREIAGPHTLADGELLTLARNLVLRYREPDPASSAAVLELVGGSECAGASRVLLCVPEAGCRVTLGPGTHSHVVVNGLARPVVLEVATRADGEGLRLRCSSELGLRTRADAAPSSALELELPPPVARFTVGEAAPGRPPACVSLEPLDHRTMSPTRSPERR